MGYFSIGVFIILIWSNYRPQKFGESPEDFLVVSFVFFLWGLSGFTMVKNMESLQADLIGFFLWKLPMVLITVGCWIFAVLSLYKFVAMLVVK